MRRSRQKRRVDAAGIGHHQAAQLGKMSLQRALFGSGLSVNRQGGSCLRLCRHKADYIPLANARYGRR